MSQDVELKPGWFKNDVQRAAQRVDQWSTAPTKQIQSGKDRESRTQDADSQDQRPTRR